MFKFIHKFRVFLWGIVAELEHFLYPWKTSTAPQWAISRYGLDNGIVSESIDYENNMYYDWLKCQDQKIQKIEENIIYLTKKINELEK